MNLPERKESTPSSTSEELTQRFLTFFHGIEPTTTSHSHEVNDVDPFARRFHRRPKRRQLKQEITKQAVTRRVDDKKYLGGPYRNAEWGELVVEHITVDKISDAKTGELVESKPERYVLKFIDHSRFDPSNGVADRPYTSSDLAFSYEFSPSDEASDLAITSNVGPAINPGDGNYPYFIRALEMAEEVLAANP